MLAGISPILSPSVLIVHRSPEVFQMASGVRAEVLLVIPCLSTNTGTSIRPSQEFGISTHMG